jgi:hypothetical protein
MRSDYRAGNTGGGRPSREDRTRQNTRGRGVEAQPEHRGIPKHILIGFGVMAVVILSAVGMFILMNSGSGIASVYIGNVEMRDRDDLIYSPDTFPETVYIPLLASSDGFGKAKGTVTIEITYGTEPTVLHRQEVKIHDDLGSTWIHMDRFVIGNGEYTIKATAGGKTDSRTLRISSVVEDLSVKIDHAARDSVLISHSYGVSYTATPVDRAGKSLGSAPMPFDVRARLSAPDGEDLLSLDWPHSSSYILDRYMVHTKKGEYTLTIEWTNLMCRNDSPFRTITSSKTILVDAAPYADAGDDMEISLVDGEAEISFDASGSGDDGSIVEYRWDFGDGQTATTQGPYVTHKYTQAGEYFVALIVKDDSGQTSASRWGGTATITVTV